MHATRKGFRLVLSVGGAVLFLIGLAVATRVFPSLFPDETPRHGG